MKANKHLLLWTSLGTLALLAWAAYDENSLQEWRQLQREYRSLLPADQREAFAVQLRQIVVPALDASDRDRKSTRLNSSHSQQSRMPSSA